MKLTLLGGWIDQAIPRRGSVFDPLRCRAHRQESLKRRRVDEDLKMAVTTGLVESGQVSTSRCAAKVLRLGKNTDKWDEEQLRRYQASCWRACDGDVTLLCRPDSCTSAYSGRPLKIYLLFACKLFGLLLAASGGLSRCPWRRQQILFRFGQRRPK